MAIHSEDNTKVQTKITNGGELFLFCPECKGIWETALTVVKKPRETRKIDYGGAKIDLAVVPEAKTKTKNKTAKEMTALAKELFPEAFK